MAQASTMANDDKKKKKVKSKRDIQEEIRRAKRAKLKKAALGLEVLGTDRFTRLPLELVAAILCLTTTRDVLAVARCSRHLCRMLVDFPSCNFIWRQARLNSSSPIPDPLPNLTEASYAALLFDPGVCEQCGTAIKAPFTSFALRLRICDKGDCMKDWVDQKGFRVSALASQSRPYTNWLVASRCRTQFRYSYGTFELLCRKSDYERLESAFRARMVKGASLTDYMKAHEFDSQKKNLIELHDHNVRLWWESRLRDERTSKHANANHAQSFAAANSWRYWDLMETRTFREFYVCKKRSAEEMSKNELDILREPVQNEIDQLIRKREARTEHEERGARVQQVKKLYARLRTSEPTSAFPTLRVFQELGVVSIIVNNRQKTASDAKEDLASPGFQSLLQENLSVWRDNQQRVLLKLMGRPNYRHVNNKKPHPMDWPTARFICTKCKHQATKNFKPVSLSFLDVCKHECAGSSKPSSRAWSITQFALDEKSLKVTNELLELVGLKEEESSTEALFHRRVLCESCDGMVVIDNLKRLHEHCQRHDEMKFSLFKDDHISPKLEGGLRDELLSLKKSSKKKRQTKSFSCRHCRPRLNSEGKFEIKKKSYQRFDLDGVRSHLKACHGVEYFADEDFYRI